MAYLFKLDPVMVLEETDEFRQQAREAAVLVVARLKTIDDEDME